MFHFLHLKKEFGIKTKILIKDDRNTILGYDFDWLTRMYNKLPLIHWCQAIVSMAHCSQNIPKNTPLDPKPICQTTSCSVNKRHSPIGGVLHLIDSHVGLTPNNTT